MIRTYRHGDLAFVLTATIPENLKESDSPVILQTGSGGNPHSQQGGKFYPKVDGNYIIGFFDAPHGAILLHKEHGEEKRDGLKKSKLPKGKYEVRRQIEKTHEGMKPVID